MQNPINPLEIFVFDKQNETTNEPEQNRISSSIDRTFRFTFPSTQVGRSYKSSPTRPTGQTPTDRIFRIFFVLFFKMKIIEKIKLFYLLKQFPMIRIVVISEINQRIFIDFRRCSKPLKSSISLQHSSRSSPCRFVRHRFKIFRCQFVQMNERQTK